MPVYNILGRNVIDYDQRSWKTYWPKLSKHILSTHGEGPFTETSEKVLISCLDFFINEFLTEISSETNASFYSFTFGFHETSIEIWEEEIKGASTAPMNKSYFAIYRRTLKLILEQACDLNLVVPENILQELSSKRIVYKTKLEDLLYLGHWIYTFAEKVSCIKMIGPFYQIEFDSEQQLIINPLHPMGAVFNLMYEDYPYHADKVVIDNNGLVDLKEALQDVLDIDYEKAVIFLQDPNFNKLKYNLINLDELLNRIVTLQNLDKKQLETFFQGLILSSNNKLSVLDSILRPQEIDRYLYKPILKFKTDKGEYVLIGNNKWRESFIQIVTNAIPWGYAPSEWKQIKKFKKYVSAKELSHDSLLEDPLEQLLIKNNYKYERNAKSFKQKSKINLICEIPGVGEIDILYVDEKYKILYVCECKYNRSRFDMVAWYKEYSNFVSVYETKVTNKVSWVDENKAKLSEHFQLKYDSCDLDLSDYTVRGIFLINAPSFYLYNGNFKCFTLNTFEELLEGNYIEKEYLVTVKDQTDKGKLYNIKYPYFKNAFLLTKSKT